MKGKLFVLFLVCFLVIPFSRIDSQENYRHIITGYGLVGGDLFAPKSLATFNNTLYVLLLSFCYAELLVKQLV